MGTVSVIKRVLVITDDPYLRIGIDANHDPTTPRGFIKECLDCSALVEFEEPIDCMTSEFHRTGDQDYDFSVYIGKRGQQTYWHELESRLEDKVDGHLHFLDSEGHLIRGDGEQLSIEGLLSESNDDATESGHERMLSQLSIAMRLGQDLRCDMLVRILLLDCKTDRRELISTLNEHPEVHLIAGRIGSLICDEGGIPSVNEFLPENWPDSKVVSLLIDMAVFDSGIPVEEFNEIIDSNDDINSIARTLFLRSGTPFSCQLFLNLSNGGKRYGTTPNDWIFRNIWADDLAMMEKWTEVFPEDHESWQVYSRALWNQGSSDICAEVAVKGLEYHPESHHLLRRKAHGLRIKGEHGEAVQIERYILESDSDRLNPIDTIAYLTRSLLKLKEWHLATRYLEQGLSLDPDHTEFSKNLELAKSELSSK